MTIYLLRVKRFIQRSRSNIEYYLSSAFVDFGIFFIQSWKGNSSKRILLKNIIVVIQCTFFDQCQVLSSSFDILSITDLHQIFLMESFQPQKI